MKKAKFEFIAVFSATWDVSLICSALGVTRQGYYACRKRGASAHSARDAELAEAIGFEYGSPKIWIRLRRRGSAEKCACRKESAPDLVKRNFEADGPNQARFVDTTHVRTYQGWLCLAVVMDVWSRKIVGWSMAPRMTAEIADDASRWR